MGYTTDFNGAIEVSPPLNPQEVEYLRKFSDTRRMNREKGPYFVDGRGGGGQGGGDDDIIGYNEPPEGQPGLWCHWVPTEFGEDIEWDGGEKFYNSVEWMEYIIDHFLKPDGHSKGQPGFEAFTFDHICNGVIYAEGEDPDDRWALRVKDNVVEQFDAAPITYPGLDS